MPRRPTISALSSFSSIPSTLSVRFASQYDDGTPTEENPATLSGSTLADQDSGQIIPRGPLTRDAPHRISKAFVDNGTGGLDDLVPVQQVVEVLAQDLNLDTKKKRSLVRAMKKAGMLAVKKIHVPKTWSKRHGKPSKTGDVQEACMKSKEDPAAGGVPVAESIDSLAVECGSPRETATFPMTPPLIARDSLEVTRLHQARAGRDRHPTFLEGPLSPGPVPLAAARMFVKVLLFAPYAVLVGFLPFVSPNSLSSVVFSPIINITSAPLAPIDKFIYHARVLPYHVGVSLGLLLVALWGIGRTYPGPAAVLLAAFVGRTIRAWSDHEPANEVTNATLGVDDRSTILWLLKSFVLGDSTHSWKNFVELYCEPEVEDGDEDVETETWEREGSRGIDFVIRLKDRPHECLRIVVDSADPTE